MTYESGLTVITPTGGRPEAFSLCQKYMARQAWRGPLQWIIVSDVEKISGLTIEWADIKLIYPDRWTGTNSLARNILAALPYVKYDRVVWVEDDDHYSSSHLFTLAEQLVSYGIVGNPVSRYYHIPSRRYRIMANNGCASLCQTGIRSEFIPLLKRVCQSTEFIDFRLWSEFRSMRKGISFFSPDNTCVGIKGLPGRRGIGVGHRPDEYVAQWVDDLNLTILRSWIGSDFENYREFMK